MLRTTIALTALMLAPALASADSITVYSAGPASLAEALQDAFEAETGIEVDLFQGTTGDVMARLEAEESNPQADVVISASWASALDLHDRGLLMEYTSPNAETVPDFLKHSHYVAQAVSALAIAWNTESGTPRPSDWGDLADDDYTDLVTMPDPSQSGSAFELVAGLQETMGEDAWTLFGDLADNGMIVPGANAAALNPVLQGAAAAVFGAVDYISYGRAESGESIEVITPESGTVIAPRPMMILGSTDAPESAQAFIDFVLSEAGQELVAEVFLMPSRTDVEARRPGLNELDIIELDPEELDAQRTEILERYNEVVLGR
ncbi:MAG: ABC transporter substrate-binding protein [Rhodosalinus sp.]